MVRMADAPAPRRALSGDARSQPEVSGSEVARSAMAEQQQPGQPDKAARFAQRIDPKRDPLEPVQRDSMRRAELALWARNAHRMRGRNVVTGLSIGALVLGIYGYTFYSVSQEKFLDELEEEAKVARARVPKTSAN